MPYGWWRPAGREGKLLQQPRNQAYRKPGQAGDHNAGARHGAEPLQQERPTVPRWPVIVTVGENHDAFRRYDSFLPKSRIAPYGTSTASLVPFSRTVRYLGWSETINALERS